MTDVTLPPDSTLPTLVPRPEEVDSADERRSRIESSLIYGILSDPEAFAEVSEYVDWGSFSDPTCMLAFNAMAEIAGKGDPLNQQTVLEAMLDSWMDNGDVRRFLRARPPRRTSRDAVLNLSRQVRSLAFDHRVRTAANWLSFGAEINDRRRILEAYAHLNELFGSLASITPEAQEWDFGNEAGPGRPRGTALYRWFDVTGRLLYIGVSGNLSARQDSHSVHSSWSDFAVDCKIERYPSRDLALAAEKAAIQSERPLFNRVHNNTAAARQRLVDYLVQHGRTDLLTASVSRG